MSAPFQMLIDGSLVSAERSFTVIDPATLAEVGRAPCCSLGQLDDCVTAARRAAPGWWELGIAARQAMVERMGRSIAAAAEELAALLTAEQGRPLAQATGEVNAAAARCLEAATIAIDPEVLRDDGAARIVLHRVPLGVVAAMVPWNFPIILATIKVAAALCAGNTVILKPSPFTPLTTLRIAALLKDVFPAGVFNVITGEDELGPWITEHPGIDKISFTGSSATGRRVMASAAPTLKRLTLELGGNDAAIVMADVDVATVAAPLFWAAVRNAGQICVASKRIYVHDAVYDRLVEAFVAIGNTVRMGPGTDPMVQLGPLQNKPHYDRVTALIADSEAAGLSMRTLVPAPDGDGLFAPVILVDNPPENARIVEEEQFAPIVPFLRFTDVDEVVARVNAGPYGLGATVWTSDPDLGERIAARLQVGTVWINQGAANAPMTPFAGLRQSGIGVEGGREGLLEYTAIKIVNRKVA